MRSNQHLMATQTCTSRASDRPHDERPGMASPTRLGSTTSHSDRKDHKSSFIAPTGKCCARRWHLPDPFATPPALAAAHSESAVREVQAAEPEQNAARP